jgi:glutamate synthase (NADPH/NADH) small chain
VTCKPSKAPRGDLVAENQKVVGGGNVAMDAVRTALRLGADNAYLVYRRGMEELPARKEEVERAQHEGVQFKKMCWEKKGTNFVMKVDAVIPSIGTSANPLLAQTTPGTQFNRKGYIVVESEKTGRTTKKGVFAGGDIVTGAATVILAAGAGRSVGMAIDKYLKDGEWWDPNAPRPAEAPAAE